MLKSTEDNHNNIYRIVKILSNQDYLVVDQQSQNYILAEKGIIQLSKKVQSHHHNNNQSCRIVSVKQQITLQNMSYSVFQLSAQTVIWAKNIEQKQLQSHNFVNEFVKEAIKNILQDLLWMNPKHVLSIIHINNFWLLDGRLFILQMPRVASIRKTQKNRSYSHQLASISTILDKQRNIIKKFAECLWQVLFHKNSDQIVNKQFKGLQLLLTKMIKKQLNFQEILSQVNILSIDFGQTRVKKYRFDSPLRKQLLSKKKYSQPLILNLNTGKKKRNSFHTLEQSSISKTLGYKNIFQYKKRSITLPVPRQTKSLMQFNRMVLMQRAKSTEPRQKLSSNLVNSNIKKILTTPNRNSIKRVSNQKDRGNYLQWLQSYKFNMTTPIEKKGQNVDLKKQPYKKQEQQIKKQSTGLRNEEQLKKRLLAKIEKIRTSRYSKTVCTQTINSQIEATQSHKVSQSHQKDYIPESNVPSEYLPSYALKQNSFEAHKQKSDQQKKQQVSSFSLFQQIPPKINIKNNQIIQPIARKLSYEVIAEHKDNQLNKVCTMREKIDSHVEPVKRQSSWGLNISNIEQSRIEEISFQAIKNKLTPFDTSSQQLSSSNINSFRRQQSPTSIKQNKIKLSKQVSDHVDLQELQTISFGLKVTDKTGQSSKNKQKSSQYILQKNPFRSQDQFIETQLFKRKKQQEKLSQTSSQQLMNSLKDYIQEYLTMINILADISVNCVKKKANLKQTKWRVSVFFLYERFYCERVEFLKNLRSAQVQKLVRRHRNISLKIKSLWLTSEHRIKLIDQIQRQNMNIAETFERLSKKTLEQCELQPNIKQFITNRDKILSSNKAKVRPFLSKYAVAFIINQYDQIFEKSRTSEAETNYILRCVFGLEILSQLDEKQQKNKSLRLGQYNKYSKLKDVSHSVEQIYNLYYPQSQGEAVV